jgi:hypothetical protein
MILEEAFAHAQSGAIALDRFGGAPEVDEATADIVEAGSEVAADVRVLREEVDKVGEPVRCRTIGCERFDWTVEVSKYGPEEVFALGLEDEEVDGSWLLVKQICGGSSTFLNK